MDTPPLGNENQPVVALFGVIAAAVMAGVYIASAIVRNPVIAAPQAALSLLGLVGLRRREASAGYGLALFLCFSAIASVFSSYWIGGQPTSSLLAGAIVPVLVAAFAFVAGNALLQMRRGNSKWLSILPWVGCAAVPVTLASLFSCVTIATGSMEPTLFAGDDVVVFRCGAQSLHRGDLTVYREPGKQAVLVKRLVGIGGDRIHLDRKVLYLNGKSRQEGYVIHSAGAPDQYRDNFPLGDLNLPLPQSMRDQLHAQVTDGDFVVPAASFFFMDDNRDMSLDSRYYGVVPTNAVIGKAVMVCFSTNLPPEVIAGPPGYHNVLTAARWSRTLMRVF